MNEGMPDREGKEPMSIHRHAETISTLLALLTLALCTAPAQQPAGHALDLTLNKPEAVGFSSERLERLHALLQQEVDQKQIAGIVTIRSEERRVGKECRSRWS